MAQQTLYPLTFAPLLKEVIWGGQDIRPFKGLEPDDKKVGESWEISHVDDNYSIVAEGALKGQNLDELLRTYGDRLVGARVKARFGDRFPLLIKFIDARDYLYVKRIAEGTIVEALAEYEVKPGHVFFLPAGRVHAIGAGCFIAEIQQTSNITYRIYDYDRTDAAGNKRELHTELAKDAIDYLLQDDYRTAYTPAKDQPVDLVSCPYFETKLLDLDAPLHRDWSALDSFVIYICMEGALTLRDAAGYEVQLHQGQSVLVPAENSELTLLPSPSCKLLETYIPEL